MFIKASKLPGPNCYIIIHRILKFHPWTINPSWENPTFIQGVYLGLLYFYPFRVMELNCSSLIPIKDIRMGLLEYKNSINYLNDETNQISRVQVEKIWCLVTFKRCQCPENGQKVADKCIWGRQVLAREGRVLPYIRWQHMPPKWLGSWPFFLEMGLFFTEYSYLSYLS